jgi:hypothetical protein
VEIDHVLWFVPELAAVAPALTGFTLDPGRRHVGQGTVNRRVMFARNYLELLWIDEPAEVAARGLGFEPRCAWAPGACPFGVVLRGEVPASARAAFTRYAVPGAAGMSLLLLTATLAAPRLPFVAVFEARPADLAAQHPAARLPPAALRHASGATSIVRATFTAPLVPDLDAGGEVRFVAGAAPRLDLVLASLAEPVDLAGGVSLRAAP